ncbi:MAG: hypothetical protein MJ088_02715 [Clostridia bacterium]|nr:hypothetical protein [Clostridia bacterium]
MNKRICRAAALLLSALLMLGLLTGCGIIIIHRHGTPETTETAGPGPVGPETTGDKPVTPHHLEIKDYSPDAKAYLASLGTANYDGKGFIVATAGADGSDSTSLAAAVYSRNKAVEGAFGISLLFIDSDEATLAEKLREADASDLYYADLLDVPAAAVAPLAAEGLLGNLLALPFVHPDAGYFNPTSVDAFTVGETLWAIAGQATLDADLLPALYFNRQTFSDAGLEMPYTAVYDGTFTWDTLFAMTETLRASGAGVNVSVSAEDGADAVFTAAGGRFTTRSAENVPVLGVAAASLDETRISVVRRLLDLPQYVGGGERDAFFEDDQILFLFDTLAAGTGRGTSATKWGLLPMPALTESDAVHPYRSLLPSSAHVYAAPKNNSGATLTGRVLSGLNAASYGVLLTAEAAGRSDRDFRDLDSEYMFVEIGFGAAYDFTSALAANDAVLPGLVRGLVRRSAAGEDLAELLGSDADAINKRLASFVP